MNVLILGRSDIAVRRIIPALRALPDIGTIDVASRSRPTPIDGVSRVHAGYEEALRDSTADLVHVSLVNSLHYEWAKRSLDSGRHTIVDKPACLDHEQTIELAQLATRKNVCVGEATVFSWHPQFRVLENLSAEHGPITRVAAAFSFPPLPDHNFRNEASLGGGALADLGPYVAGIARLHFKGPPSVCSCRILARHPLTGVDISFAVSLGFGAGESFVGHFGFDTQYQNRLEGFGPAWSYSLNRAFTTPPEMLNELDIAVRGQGRRVPVPAGDSFVHFFGAVQQAIRQRMWDRFNAEMVADSHLRDLLVRNGAGEQR